MTLKVMNESNSIELIDRTDLSEQTKFWLDEISKIENYFQEGSKKLSKYVAAFDYIGKILIVLSATAGGVSIFSFTSVVGAAVRIASASFTLIFSLIITKHNKIQKEKTFILAKSKLRCIEIIISQALIDMEISHEEFVTILKEKDKYGKMKENLRNENEKQEIVRLIVQILLNISCHQKKLFLSCVCIKCI